MHAVPMAHAARKPVVPTYPPPLRIRSPRGPPKGRPPFPSSLFLGYLNLVQWSGLLIHGRPTTHFSTAYQGRWSIENYSQIICLIGDFVTCGLVSIVPGRSQPQKYQIQSLDFFPLRALFLRYLILEFRLTPPSSDYPAHIHLLSQMAQNRGKFFGTFTLQSHGRPKIKVFQKTPSKFASKN